MSTVDSPEMWRQLQQQQHMMPYDSAPTGIHQLPIWTGIDMPRITTEEQRISAKYDILILREVKALTDKELVSLHKMITSVDHENFVVATEIIKQKFDNYKDEI